MIGQCQQHHTHVEWLKFLRQIDRETPKDKTLHLIADNYATHKHPAVQEWLSKHPRFNMHFTPTSASWLNMVERFFRDLTTERLRRGVFTSVPDLVAAIDEYVAHHNTDPKPFIWTKSARDILQKVIRANSRLSSKQNGTLHQSGALGQTACGGHLICTLRLWARQSRRYKLIRLWYGTPASSAMPLKYSTTSSDSRMVTGFFNFEAYGFLRDFNLERSYSAFMSTTLIKRAFAPGCLASGDDANGLAVFTLAMTDDKQLCAGTHTQQQKSLFV